MILIGLALGLGGSLFLGEEALRPSTHAFSHRKEIHRLKQLLAERPWRWDFFKGALQRVEARR